MKALYGLLAVLILSSAALHPAAADERRGDRDRGRHEGWRGEIHRFNEHDLGRWRAGHWYRGPHEGRSGWWWIVGGIWYFYPTPIYPYPDPYEPPIVVAPSAPPAPQYWYYCANPQGYYPYVPNCPGPWQRVPARPPPAAPR